MSVWGRSCAICLLAVGALCQAAMAQTPDNPFRSGTLEPDVPVPEPVEALEPTEADPFEAEPIQPGRIDPEVRVLPEEPAMNASETVVGRPPAATYDEATSDQNSSWRIGDSALGTELPQPWKNRLQ